MKQIIKAVKPGSVGEELGFEPGDAILSVNGTEIEDVLDYYFLTDDEAFTLSVETKQGELVECEVERDPQEELGLVFEEEFMGKYRHCANHCLFCFIDQLPKGMRDTLYFKDDDSRLSFLNGNYITMTNMSEADFAKIIRYHMSPMNISVHTTNPELRVRMLKNPRAAEIMPRLKALAEAGITLNGQIVLCKGINDGAELDRTLRELGEFCPAMQSLSVVPVGLSDHREGLYPLEPFTAEDAKQLIEQIKPYQEKHFAVSGLHFVHLADEFYSLAGLPLPEEEEYDGYLQIENGVGMMRLFMNEAREAIASLKPDPSAAGRLSLVTAPCAEPYIRQLLSELSAKRPQAELDLRVIRNDFFGQRITVTGLLTGRDIIAQLSGTELGSVLLLPGNLLRGDESLLLDGLTVEDIEKALQTPVFIVKSSGRDFVEAIARFSENGGSQRRALL